MKRSPLVVLCGAVLVDMIGFGIILPLLPFYAESMGASPVEVTLLVASYSGMQLVAAPFWGRVSDRRGRRPLLVASLFASAVSYLIFGLATSLWLLFVSRIAAGAAGGTITLAQAYVADTTTAGERARGLGWLGAASALGIMLGPSIGGYFAQYGLGVPGFVAAGLCALNGVAAILLLSEPPARPEREWRRGEAATVRGWLAAMTRFPLSVLLGVYFLSISSFTGMTAVLALYMERTFAVDAAAMGVVFTIAGGASVVVRGVLLGPLVRWFGEVTMARIGVMGLGLGIGVVPLLPGTWWIALSVLLWAFGAGTLFPSLASLTSQATDAGSQGSILGGSQVVGGLGRVLGPVWAGVLFQRVGIASPFWAGLGCVTCAGLLALRIRQPRQLRLERAGVGGAGAAAPAPAADAPAARAESTPPEQ